MANDVGTAIHNVNPGALIIVEGAINNGNLCSGQSSGLNGGAPIQDLSCAQKPSS
jgi:hypothetical protein